MSVLLARFHVLLKAFAALVATTIPPGPPSRAAAGDGTCPPGWKSYRIANVENGRLAAIDAISRSDIWAAGVTDSGENKPVLLAHWSESKFSRYPSSQIGILRGLAAVATDDVWAVGTTTDTVARSQPLIMHWNGRTFRKVATPAVRGGQLNAVVARTSNDVWAVGQRHDNKIRPLVLRWDGRRWTSSVLLQYNAQLLDVAIVRKGILVAVGTSGSRGKAALALRWTGSRWRLLNPLRVGGLDVSSFPALNGVDGIRLNDLWAVGSLAAGPLAQRWNGRRWTVQKVPRSHYAPWYERGENSRLNDVLTLGRNNVWAVGFGVEHWNGSRWQRRRIYEVEAHAITATSPNELWVAGDGWLNGPLFERYCSR